VSELFGNSVRHSDSGLPGETVTVAVTAGDGIVRSRAPIAAVPECRNRALLTVTRTAGEHQNITFKGIVGPELKARGLDVDLVVYSDEDYFDACAEIVATAPGAGDEAKVCVTDDGCLTWAREDWAEADAIVSGPEFSGWIANPASVAATVAETVTRAMSCLHGSGQRRRSA